MTPKETISLRESLPPDVGEQDGHNIEQAASNPNQADSRQWESTRKRACVLLGSAILQLPIWGKKPLFSWLQFYSNMQASP